MASLTLLLLGSAATAGAQAAEGLASEATYRYELAENSEGVDVTIDLAITNVKPNRTTNRGVTQYYFTGYYVTVPDNATDITISQDGTLLDVESYAEDGFTTLEIDFRRNLFYRNTANIEISYRLSNGGPRSNSPARINEAYAGFEVWVTPGIDDATVQIVIPDGFEPDRWVAGSTTRTDDNGIRLLEVADITAEDFFYDYISLRNDDRLTRRSVSVDGIDIEIQHWPNDRAWADYVEDRLTEDLPSLIDTVGLEWPLDEPLVIRESHAPLLSGYGGWYDMDEHVIEVGDEFDGQLLLHEVAHVWANRDLFASRWITEGIADELAAIIDADGDADDLAEPEPTSLVDANAIPLLNWGNGFALSSEAESWGYSASWTVTREITDEIGIDGFQQVIIAASEGTTPYVGEDSPETMVDLASWKNYLDWIEMHTDDDTIEELFRDWVVPGRFADQLDERADARTRYDELADAGAEWTPPLVVRTQMTEWDFDEANTAMDDAFAVLAERDRAIALTNELGVTPPEAAELAYQSADSDLEQALDITEELTAAAETLAEIQSDVDAERTVFARIGLIGTDLTIDRVAAIEAFETGRFDEMAAAGETLSNRLDGAKGVGQQRIAITAALVLLLGLLLTARHRRRRNTDEERIEDDTIEADRSEAELVAAGATAESTRDTPTE